MARRPKTPPPLADLEAEVMDRLWDLEEASVRELVDVCNAGRAKPRAYTTYLTIMARLEEKGVVTRRRHGKSDRYRPVWSREEFAAGRVSAEVDALVHRYGDVALTHFAAQVGRLDPARRRALQRLARSGEPD
jgi:predicted transcriptional regulator